MDITDTHAHLDYSDYDQDRDLIIQRAREASVSKIITIGIGRESIQRSLKLCEKYKEVYATVGVHPTDLDALSFDEWDLLEKAAIHPRVVAIGETGLDYHRLGTENMDAQKKRQKDYFLRQLELASRVKKPVVIHCRDAYEDTLKLVREFTGNHSVHGVFHCFGGDIKTANQIFDLGFIISVGGVITFKNAESLRELVKLVPRDKLILETDCPYLAPTPYRGKRNEPAYTRLVAEKVSEVWGTPLIETTCHIEKTVKRTFSGLNDRV